MPISIYLKIKVKLRKEFTVQEQEMSTLLASKSIKASFTNVPLIASLLIHGIQTTSYPH